MAYAQLMRWDKPIGLLLLLWPTLWALWIAGQGKPWLYLVVIFLAGIFLTRSAGCVINDLADRDFDAKVARTRYRPLVIGDVSKREALLLFLVLMLLAANLLWFLNPLTRLLTIPAILLIACYPFMKRYTHLPQLVLGIAFSWGVPMAFAAQTGHISSTGWLLFFIACLWPIAYDTIYAMVDRTDDLTAGVKSTAILLGRWDTKVVALLHGLMLLSLIGLGLYLNFPLIYYGSLVVTAGIMVYLQHLIHDREPARCFQAFLASQWLGCAVFVGLFFSLGHS